MSPSLLHTLLADGEWERAEKLSGDAALERGIAQLGQRDMMCAEQTFGEALVCAELHEDHVLRASTFCWTAAAQLLRCATRLGLRSLKHAGRGAPLKTSLLIERLRATIEEFELLGKVLLADTHEDSARKDFLVTELRARGRAYAPPEPTDSWQLLAAHRLYVELCEFAERDPLVVPALATLYVEPNYKRIRIDQGQVVSLTRRRAIRALLSAFVRAHTQGNGRLHLEALLLAGWQEETDAVDKKQADRVYQALRSMRQLGLESWLERDQLGYRLSPHLAIVYEDSL